MKSVVEVRGVTKLFRPPPAPWRRWLGHASKDVLALRGVDLDVRAGEVLGLVGPNGAGKTVLMKLMATLSEPTEGTVRVFGQDSVKASRQIRARIGMATTDERSFYWRLTARQNLTFFARLYGGDRGVDHERVTALFELLDITALADRPYRALSTGNRQRLAIARALLAEPELLLLDEPTSSMDRRAASKLRELVRDRMTGTDRAVVYTSHNLDEVGKLCDRVAVLHGGRILSVTEPGGARFTQTFDALIAEAGSA